jgi:oligoribonuclease NrnB/cAMP/cGMP phosphodiesterase (DHH superfamily)
MATAIIEILSSIAPESAKIIEQLQQAKLNDKQIMISLLALNLEQCKKTECMIQQLRDLRADMARKGTI